MADGRSTVLVTGAAGGIGRAAAQRMARAGWAVLAVDRDADRLAWAEAAGIASAVADIAVKADNQRIVEIALTRFGCLDAAIFNAGVTGGGNIDAVSADELRRILDINVVGTVMGIQAALPAMRRAGGGAIAVTSSTMGLAGDAENWAYCAAKHALVGIVRSLARELGCRGIRINALCPGPTRATGMTAPVEAMAGEHFDRLAQAVPLQRWAEPDEMAAVLEFLVSPASSYVNGHALVADGGALVGTGLVPPSSAAAHVIPPSINP